MPLKPHEAIISGTSQRAETWRRVFGSEVVEIRSPVETTITIEGLGERPCYIIAVEKLSPEQMERAVAHISQRFNIAADEVRAEILGRGIPILSEDVSVCVDPRYFL